MSKRIMIIVNTMEIEAELDDSPTAALIWKHLPIEGSANTWGEEIYFSIPVKADLEPGARDEMRIGELAYWPPGEAFCIFFGRTPMSQGDECRAASPVNPVGNILGDPGVLKSVQGGAAVRIERHED